MRQKAKYFQKEKNGNVVCLLCPHRCVIENERKGICGVRENIEGELYALTYNKVSVLSTDPIEKKSLYHFYPGKDILSLGSVGCNLKCSYCKNCDISQPESESHGKLKNIDNEYLLDILFAEENTIGISYCYNEPVMWIESILDIAQKMQLHGFVNVMETNGFINKEPLDMLCDYIDAFTIDLKGFTEEFYEKVTVSSLKPVLESLKFIARRNKHFEITYLIIPGVNDNKGDFINMLKWISGELGKNVALHLNKYFPRYKMKIEATPDKLLSEMYQIACEYLTHVYIGTENKNVGRDTFCPSCEERVIRRVGYLSVVTGLNENGDCIHCNEDIIRNI